MLNNETILKINEQSLITNIDSEIKLTENELIEVKYFEEKQTIDLKLNEEKLSFLYEEELIKKRKIYEENIISENLIKKLNFEQKLIEKKELLKKQTQIELINNKNNYNNELELNKINYEKNKIKAELDAKLNQELINEDLLLRKMQLQTKLNTEQIIEVIKIIFNQFNVILNDLLTKPKQLFVIIVSILSLLIIYYLIKEFISIIKNFLQLRLGKPQLVRETSYQWSIQIYLYSFILSIYYIFYNKKTIKSELLEIELLFNDIILLKEDKKHIIQLAITTRNTKSLNIPFRHVLLFGPPGTGKTLIARKLAESSNMDYAIISGGDISSLGNDSVNQLHNLFHWAVKSKRGLLLFIDEAEAFLSSRNITHTNSNAQMSETIQNHRNALNALLSQTGNQSKSFMLILATNRPEDLDEAILDRIDITLHINLPESHQRLSLVKLYMNIHINNNIIKNQIKQQKLNYFIKLFSNLFYNNSNNLIIDPICLTEQTLSNIANEIEGFSGREISKLFIAVKYAMLQCSQAETDDSTQQSRQGGHLTYDLLQDTIKFKIKEHKQKQGFVENSNIQRLNRKGKQI